MAEGHEGDGHRARPGDKAAYRVDIHRVNDFSLGHVGQVSYKPLASDDLAAGDLGFSRVDENPPSYQQLVPFEKWLAPTKTSLALPPSTTFQRTKSQKNWLFKTHPEAFMGNLDLPQVISEETRALDAGREETQPGSLLAVGEIFDLKNTKSSRTAACPVIALAAGEAGHILQLSAISLETWTWGDASFTAGASQANFHGSWCGDGSSISKIEFATKLKQFDTIRWLIAQKETSTTVFAPELRAKPVAGAPSTSGRNDGTADHIVMNPIATIAMNVTGGEPHCDFSINLGSNDMDPQLAIIDRSGNWSIWYIGRVGHGRSKAAKAILVKQGSWAMPAPVSSTVGHQSMTHRIVWTSRSGRVDKWERESSPSLHSDTLDDGLPPTFLADLVASRPKYDGLLMCNRTQLQVLDVDGKRTPSWLDFTRRDGMVTILDTQAFHGSSSHVFLLTTDKLYLLDLSLVESQNAKSSHILVSCRHFRNDPRETLKISIAKLRYSHDEANTLVMIYSAQSFRVDLFWFGVTQKEGMARFHRQVVHFPGLSTANVGRSQGIESLAIVPLHVVPSKGKNRQTFEEGTQSHVNAQVYQLFALTANLSLSSSVVALTQGARQIFARPSRFGISSWTDERQARFLRRKWLRETEQAFVVPDKPDLVKPSSVVPVPEKADEHDVMQFRFYVLKLVQEINRAYVGDAPGLHDTEHFKSIRAALKSREEEDHMALKPLLRFSDMWQPFNLSKLDDEWGFNLRRLYKSQHAHIFECGTYGAKQSVMDFFERISINWSSSLLAESLKATQWRYMELALERMAAEVYMAEKGVYMVPQSTLDLASNPALEDEAQVKGEDELYGIHSSQPRSSQVLPTPSATPSSSRAASETVDSTTTSQEMEGGLLEDPAVARLRMYLPSIKFTPPSKSGPSRVISLWPEQRNVDPSEYQYRPPGQGPDEEAEARKRRQERKEERHRRRAEKLAQLGIKMEGAGDSYSQLYRPTMIRSSPPPQEIGSSQHQPPSQGFGGFGLASQIQNQSQSFSQGFGPSQIMSQPLPGEFGGRPRLKKGKTKIKGKERRPGF